VRCSALGSLLKRYAKDVRSFVDRASERSRYLVRVHGIARRLVDRRGASYAVKFIELAAARSSGKRGTILKAIAQSAYDLTRLDIYYH
jgi:hypothetical protein